MWTSRRWQRRKRGIPSDAVLYQTRPRPDAGASEQDRDDCGCERARARTRPVMEEIARVYAEALFEVAQDKDKLDEIHDQLDEVADAIAENCDLQVFLFSPYFSSAEKREGISRAISGAEPELTNFLELLAFSGSSSSQSCARHTRRGLLRSSSRRLNWR